MKKSFSVLTVVAVLCFLLTMLFTYLWSTLTTSAAGIFSVLTFAAAAAFVVCVGLISKK